MVNKKPHAKRCKSETAGAETEAAGVRPRPVAVQGKLFDRVAAILEQARGSVVRAVNTNMVLAYWLIGREIVQDLQGGGERAEYGKQVIDDLSKRLTERYGQGFSPTNLKYFRLFFQAYSDRMGSIRHPAGDESPAAPILSPTGGEFAPSPIQYPAGTESSDSAIPSAAGRELPRGFSPQLSWSHYRVLMRVDNADARAFYERETIEGGWDKRTLERQVHTQYYERCLHSQQPDRMIAEGRRLQKTQTTAAELLKSPYVLEFLGYPSFAEEGRA